MNRRQLLALALLAPIAACDRKEDMSPDTLKQESDPAEDEKRLRRPPPASSRMSSDPDNPNGAPGSSRVGSSSNRY
jgi:hypothetical protein